MGGLVTRQAGVLPLSTQRAISLAFISIYGSAFIGVLGAMTFGLCVGWQGRNTNETGKRKTEKELALRDLGGQWNRATGWFLLIVGCAFLFFPFYLFLGRFFFP